MRRHLTTEKIILRAKAFHGAKYDYTLTRYEGHEVKIKIICPEHGEFTKTPHKHTHKTKPSGCPTCSSIRKGHTKFSSKGEKSIKIYLEGLNISYVQQYRIFKCRSKNPLPFDFAVFDKQNNLRSLIEFDGQQHYKPVTFGGISKKQAEIAFQQSQFRDQIKNTYCKQNSIPLLRIPYYNIDTIPDILSEHLDNLLI